jgi:tripartite-type tricarboxylate transporter receptor subunit TctC
MSASRFIARRAGVAQLRIVCFFCALVAWGIEAGAQAFPSKPIRVIIPTSAGALNDLFTRTVSQQVSEAIRQPLLVENRPGAGSIIGALACAKAPADGHTVCVTTPEPLVLNPNLFTNLPYDADKDFAPVTLLARTTGLIVAGAAAPGKSFPELMAYAKANPGKLNFATWGAGSVPAVNS